MNRIVQYEFDFGQPGRIRWKSNVQRARDVSVPEHFLRFTLNDTPLAAAFETVIDPTLADALDIAVAVHMADRLALREQYIGKSRLPVHRNLSLNVAVRRRDLWQDQQVLCAVTNALEFLTQDTWDIRFTKREFGRSSDAQGRLFPPNLPENPKVFLYSGGLDSFCGAAMTLSAESSKHLVAVSASPTNIHRAWQKQQFSFLCDKFARTGTHLSVQYKMLGSAKTLQEPSRRTRAFAFLLMGAAAAITAGSQTLTVFENGVGAINLPYDLSQVGVDHTRAMHPKTLRSMAELVSLITGRQFSISNPCSFMTKANMCRHEAVRTVADGIRLTYSCDGLARNNKQCGFCTSCLLRIQSLEAAGLPSFDRDGYLNLVSDRQWAGKRHQLRGLLGMTWQALRIQRCLSSKDQWTALLRDFPELQLASAENELQSPGKDCVNQLINLYQSHAAEWLSFSGLQHLSMSTAA